MRIQSGDGNKVAIIVARPNMNVLNLKYCVSEIFERIEESLPLNYIVGHDLIFINITE